MSPLRIALQVDLASELRFAWSSNRLDARTWKQRVLVHVKRQAETPRLCGSAMLWVQCRIRAHRKLRDFLSRVFVPAWSRVVS
jgi:hypothetical protein